MSEPHDGEPPPDAPRPFRPDEHPEIDYPCRWEYRVIGDDEQVLRLAVLSVVSGLEHAITPGNLSRTGRYVSLSVFVRVLDERQRLELFDRLAGHDAVRYLL